MNLLVKMATEREIEGLREQFMRMDKDKTGDITPAELKDALNEAQVHLADDRELDNILAEVDYHGDKKINYSEFLSATIQVKSILTEERLHSIFNQFDTDGQGKITAGNIVRAMKKLGRHDALLDPRDLQEIFDKYDVDKNGDITFEEFKRVFENI
jgi:Ca2+-binding EF-hand superfamily protein